MLKEDDVIPNQFVNEAFAAEEDNIGSSRTSTSPTNVTATPNVNPLSVPHFEDEGGGCGWLSFRPQFLQSLRTSKWALLCLCCAAAIQGMVINGFINVCITTIEKRYNLKSSTAGLIAGSYDVGAVLCSIPVSYFGSLPGASKPRWLGWGLLVMGLGSFVFALPHFIAPPYEPQSVGHGGAAKDAALCRAGVNDSNSCNLSSERWLSEFQYVFLVGQFLHGVGASPLYTLGVAYLDESVPVKMSSFYLGIFHAMAVIGPAAGYVIGGQLINNLFVDVMSNDPSLLGISRGSDQWIGAWWVGFVISGLLAVSISWILMSFPAEIPGAKSRALNRTCAESHTGAKALSHVRHMPGAMKVLLCNLPFVFLSLAQAADGILISGLATFMPKVIENQFGVSAGFAGLLVGFLAVPAGGGGTFLGGWLVKRLRLQCEGILRFCLVLSAAAFLFTFGFMAACPEQPFAGLTVHYADRSLQLTSPSLTSQCNANCKCDSSIFDPVCGANKVMYNSPCYAGCLSQSNLNQHQIFQDCICLESEPFANMSAPLHLVSGEALVQLPPLSASRQKCPSECQFLTLFLVLFFIVMLFTFLLSMPAMAGTLRCVPDTHRSFALGLQGITIRILGTIPGPILFGVAMDQACSLWQTTCSGTGSCRVYSNAKMGKYLSGLSAVFKAITTSLFFLSWIFYKRKLKVNSIKADEVKIGTAEESPAQVSAIT